MFNKVVTKLNRGDSNLPSLDGERIFGRVEQSGTRQVEGSWELSDTPNNPRQGWGEGAELYQL